MPKQITRVASRFINRMSLTLPIHEFSDYLASPPSPSLTNESALTDFFQRFSIHNSHCGLSANVIQSLERNLQDHLASLLLDIDVFKIEALPPAGQPVGRAADLEKHAAT